MKFRLIPIYAVMIPLLTASAGASHSANSKLRSGSPVALTAGIAANNAQAISRFIEFSLDSLISAFAHPRNSQYEAPEISGGPPKPVAAQIGVDVGFRCNL
ncbi:MAG TPA: hypothetical protein VGX94_12080 [Terriglobia bacterium]|nr:hypothetical protein [Terriglobia bacterium]